MKKILLIFASFFAFSLSGTEPSISPYKQSPIDTKFHIFTTLINDTSTITALNAAIKSFAQLNKENERLVKSDSRFKNAIKKKKNGIIKNAKNAQELFDKAVLTQGIKPIDFAKNGPNAKNAEGTPGLADAIRIQDKELVEALLKFGSNPNIEYYSKPALWVIFPGTGYWKNEENRFQIVKLLVDAGFNVNATDDANWTLLDHIYAIGSPDRNSAPVQYLLMHGGRAYHHRVDAQGRIIKY